jgi:uncharacterized protein (TIGR03437 family)
MPGVSAKAKAVVAATAVAVPFLLYAFSSNPPAGSTGAPGDSLCTRCHAGTLNPPGGSVRVEFPGDLTYTPGNRQIWTVRITDPSARVFGFQLTVRLASNESNSRAGELVATDGNTVVVRSGEREFIGHLRLSTTGVFSFAWNPPGPGAGPVRVYVAAAAANGDGRNTGDRIYTASYTLNPAAAPPLPTIRMQDGVLNGASFLPGIAAGSWVSIFGENLAPTTRIWRADEIVDGKLPTELDGVRVSINNKPAAVYYISPTQLNVQAPDDDSLGPVEVRVTTPNGTSQAAVAQLQKFAPGFFLFDPQGRKYIAAVHAQRDERGNVVYVGPEGLFPGASVRPARPGDVILLFGTGFGPTDPAVPAGRVVTSAARLANPVQIRFGNVVAEVQFAGLAPQAAGLYQFNVVVPAVPDGDVEVIAEIGGVRTQSGAMIHVKR